jgi:hypothetical protein
MPKSSVPPHRSQIAMSRSRSKSKPRGAVVTRLGVYLRRLSRETHLLCRTCHGHPVRRTGERLAIRSAANRDLRRIDIGLTSHAAAMTVPDDVHRLLTPKQTAPEGAVLSRSSGLRRVLMAL